MIDWQQWIKNNFVYIAVILGILLRSFVLDMMYVSSHSMQPTILTGDILLIDKYAYGFNWKSIFLIGGVIPASHSYKAKNLKRGDKIVFTMPYDRMQSVVKRVYGLPGDIVEFSNEKIIVNEDTLFDTNTDDYKMDWIKFDGEQSADKKITPIENVRWYEIDHQHNHKTNSHYLIWSPRRNKRRYKGTSSRMRRVRVPPGHVMIIGDNFHGSLDSRSVMSDAYIKQTSDYARFFTFVPISNIIGAPWKVLASSSVYWDLNNNHSWMKTFVYLPWKIIIWVSLIRWDRLYKDLQNTPD